MDPDATLAQLRSEIQLAMRYLDGKAPHDARTIRLCLASMTELALAMDVWLSSGGFQPKAWRGP
jgi:hypothetical protein